jgi:hypothetical protein
VHHNVSTLKGRANNKWTEGGKLVLISCKPSEYVLSNIQLQTFLSDFLLVDSSFDEELMMQTKAFFSSFCTPPSVACLFAPFEWFACSGTDITVALYQKPQSVVCLLHFSIKPFRKDKIILESACGA